MIDKMIRWITRSLLNYFTTRTDDEVALADENFMESILLGNYAVYIPCMTTAFEDNILNLHSRLLNTTSHLERVNMVKNYFCAESFLKVVESAYAKLNKSERFVELLLKKCTEFEKSDNFYMALRCMNLAACFATQNQIGDIYLKRSKMLFAKEEWKSCLLDIEICLVYHSKSPKVRKELSIKKLKCEILGHKSPTPRQIVMKEYRDQVLFKVDKVNENVAAASKSIEIGWNATGRRGLFANEDIETGSTVIVEDPYLVNLSTILTWDMKHCVRCFKHILNVIPCPNCVFATYCSEKCRSEDMEAGHNYECLCLPYFHGAGIESNLHLSFKGIFKAGPDELLRIFTTNGLNDIENINRDRNGFHPDTGKFHSNSYFPLLNLKYHIEDDARLSEYVWFSISLVEILDSMTDFFSKTPDSVKQDFKTFVTCAAVFHIMSVPFNCVALNDSLTYADYPHLLRQPEKEKLEDENEGILDPLDVPFFSGVYPFLSLLNHSCDPSVGRINLNSGKMAIVTTRKHKAGEELLFCYGYEYETHKLDYRQKNLSSLYLFDCDCKACKGNWPMMKDMTSISKLICPKCSENFTNSEFETCILVETEELLGKCNLCSIRFPLTKLYEEMNNFRAQHYEVGLNYIFGQENPTAGIPEIINYISFLEKRVSPPSLALCTAQRLLLFAYYLHTEE